MIVPINRGRLIDLAYRPARGAPLTYDFRKVQKAMGFAQPAKIHFDNMILSDESAEKSLLNELVNSLNIADGRADACEKELETIALLDIQQKLHPPEKAKCLS